ncbi:MAG: threonine/serine exporter family protein [Clostridia bacterium]|nr:threonine/serine exporter family protein [Clostridia bacterium]
MGYNAVHTKENPQRILKLAAGIGCRLLGSGSPVNIAERAAEKVCLSYGAAKVTCFCVPCAVALSVCFDEGEFTTLNRAYYGGNDLFIQEKCFALVRDIAAGLSLEKAELRLKDINSSKPSAKGMAAGNALACGSFALFFGGNALDGIIASVVGLVTSCMSARLAKRGTGGCARVFLLSAVSGALSVILCAIMQLLGITCHTSLVLVGTLMPLIPGLMVCSALSDIISGELFSGAYRVLWGLAQTVCIVAGYAIALTASGGITAFTVASPRADLLHITICYITCASGAAGFCLAMNARGKRLLYGVAAAALSYTAYVVSRSFGADYFVSYFVAAAAAYAAAEVPARALKIPSNVFVTPAVIPLLPGASLYFAVNALVCGDMGTALACGSDAVIIFTAISAGLAAAEITARIILPKSTRCFK